MDWLTFILIYGIYGGIMTVFIVFAYRLIKRGKKTHPNNLMIGFFITGAIGLLHTVIYRTIDLLGNTGYYIIGHSVTVVIMMYTLTFLLAFNLMIAHNRNAFTKQKEILLFVITAIACGSLPFIGNVERIDDNPKYDITMFLVGLIIIFTLLIWVSYLILYINKKISNSEIRVKYIQMLIGILGIASVIIGQFFANYFGNPILRMITTFWGIMVFPSGILLFRSISEKEEE